MAKRSKVHVESGRPVPSSYSKVTPIKPPMKVAVDEENPHSPVESFATNDVDGTPRVSLIGKAADPYRYQSNKQIKVHHGVQARRCSMNLLSDSHATDDDTDISSSKVSPMKSAMEPYKNTESDIIEEYGHHDTMDEKKESWSDKYVFRPDHPLRKRWDWCGLLLVLWNACMTPLQLSYRNTFEQSYFPFVDTLADIFFIVDLVFSLNTGIENHGHVYMTYREIFKRYGKWWFMLDVMATIPWQYIVTQGSVPYPVFSFFRSLKLLRMFKAYFTMKRIQTAMSTKSAKRQLFNYGLIVVAFLHFCSCMCAALQYGVDGEDVHLFFNYTPTFWDKYVLTLYWSVMTMTTVGYGDFIFSSTNGYFFAVQAMIAAAFIYGYGISEVGFLSRKNNGDQNAFDQYLDDVYVYLEETNLADPKYHAKLRELIFFGRGSRAGPIARELAMDKTDIAVYKPEFARCRVKELSADMSFFTGCNPDFLLDIYHSLQIKCYPAGMKIIEKDTAGNAMYFIFRGKVEVLLNDSGKRITLNKGSFFGESGILNDKIRSATVRTSSLCELAVLSREKFLQAFQKHSIVLLKESRGAKKLKESLPFSKLFLDILHDENTKNDSRMNSRTSSTSFDTFLHMQVNVSPSIHPVSLEKINTKVDSLIGLPISLEEVKEEMKEEMEKMTASFNAKMEEMTASSNRKMEEMTAFLIMQLKQQ